MWCVTSAGCYNSDIGIAPMDRESEGFSREFSAALSRGLAECVEQRPVDPCKLIAGTPMS